VFIFDYLNRNKYARRPNNRVEMYAGRVVLPAGESCWVCAARPINVWKKMGQTDRQTDGRTL